MLRTRTFIVLAGAALVAVAITATVAFASGGRELSKPTTVRVEVRDGNEVLLSLNPNTNTFFGNQFVINGPLFKPGTQTGAGRAHGVCTFMDRVGDKSECAWTLYLRRGEVMLQGPVNFNLSDAHVRRNRRRHAPVPERPRAGRLPKQRHRQGGLRAQARAVTM